MRTKTPHCECGAPLAGAVLEWKQKLLSGREVTALACQNCGRILGFVP
jgi:hypothetical protein